MAKLDFPSSPTAGQVYAAPNGVNYTWDDTIGIGVWTAQTASPFTLANGGTISGTAQVGETLNYNPGTASNGVPPYTYSWVWRQASNGAGLQTDGATFVIPASLVGDNVYVELTATDSALDTATASTSSYPTGGSTITYAPFPGTSFSPAGAPNASPSTVSTATEFGTGSATWADGSTTLTSSSGILFQVNGGGYGTGPTVVADGDTVDVIWDIAAVAAAADGEVLTGQLTDGTYANEYTLTVTRGTVTGLSGFSNLTDQALSTAVSSDTITPGGFNVPVTISFAGTATDPLTTLGVSINGGAFSASPQTVNPGDTIQMQGTTGAANSTAYGVDITMGSPAATQTWTVTTTAVTPTIAQPTITSPANGSTNINPAANIPSGITLVSDTYTPLNGAGAVQTSSTWEVTSGSAGGAPISGSPFTVSSAPFTSLSIPQSSFSTSTTYYARVQYATTNATAATSEFSAWSSFGTAASFAIELGAAYGGGYFAGQINDGGTIYNLVVAPVSSGSLNGQLGGSNPTTLAYKTSASADAPSATVQNAVYGGPTTDLFKGSAAHPIFSTFINGATGPNAGAFNLATGGAGGGTGIGGYNDWYLPAKNELEILYRNLKPDATGNNTGSGFNPNAVPATSNYTTLDPAQTTITLFRAGGAQAFNAVTNYWSSTEVSSSTTSGWAQVFTSGSQGSDPKNGSSSARAVRRVAA